MSEDENPAGTPDGIESGSADAFLALVYDELKRVARHHVRGIGAGGTLCTTEVVHEAWMKLARNAPDDWQSRAHFFGAASRAMRQVLVDYARRRQADKRGGGRPHVTLGQAGDAVAIQVDEIIAVDRALGQLDLANRRLCRIVELRFFAGLSQSDVAGILGVSTRTVERDWLKARLFLKREIEAEP